MLAHPASHYERERPSRFPAEALNHFIFAIKITKAQGQETAKRLEQEADYVRPLTFDAELHKVLAPGLEYTIAV
jgi:hypothetical protein